MRKPSLSHIHRFGRNDQFLALYIPVFIEQVVATLTTMLGTILVSGVGATAVSSVGLVDSINLFIVYTLNAIATAVTVTIAHKIGAQDSRQAGRLASQSLLFTAEAAIAIGLALALSGRLLLNSLFRGAEKQVLDAASPYLLISALTLPLQAIYATSAGIMRASGNARTPMLATMLANLVYIGVAYLSITQLGLGVMGAGIGLFASRLVSCGTVLVVLLKGHGGVILPRFGFRPDFKVLAPMFHIALPVGQDSALFNGGKLVVQVFLSAMGTVAMAANAIANSLFCILELPGVSMSIVCMTLTGQSYGAGDLNDTKRQMRRFMLLSTAVLTASSALMLPILNPLIGLYAPGAETAILTRRVMLMPMIAAPLLWPSAFVAPYLLRAVGDARYTMRVTLVSMFVVRLFCSWLFGVYLHWGLNGIWVAMMLDWLVRGTFFVPRMLSSAWQRSRPSPVNEELPVVQTGAGKV
ncbi:MAG: MATE family efflux transporter [Clostridiaceae bacterium]|nr:MATE family efflux transporter [Clostridiaceae bacterium]